MTDIDQPTEENESNPVGRPLLFKDVDALEMKVQKYFDEQDPHVITIMTATGHTATGETMFADRKILTEQKPYTMSGLARSLGIDRKTLLNYSKKAAFFPTIEAARERVHEFAESQLYSRNATGAAFSLKNNFDWKDKSEVDHTSGGKEIPLLAGLASTAPLTIEDEADDSSAQADDSADKDQPA